MKYIKLNNLPGFTILEQIVVLALTAILVLIGFTAILNFQRLILKIRDNAGKDRSVYLLNAVLENDFRNSETVGWDESLNIEKASQLVKYKFGNQYLIRETTEAVDTFRFNTSDLKISGINGKYTLVEAFSFSISTGDQLYKLAFSKEYQDFKIWEVNKYGN